MLTGFEGQFIGFLCSVVEQCSDGHVEVACTVSSNRRRCRHVVEFLLVLIRLTLSRTTTTDTHALSPVRTSNNVEATFDFVEATIDFVTKKTATMWNEFIVKFRPYDKVETN